MTSSSLQKLSPTTLILGTAAIASTVSVVATLLFQGRLYKIKREKLEREAERHSNRDDFKPIQLNEYGVPVEDITLNGSKDAAPAKQPLFGSSSAQVAPAPAPTDVTFNKEFNDELIREQLARNIAFLGEDGYQKVRDTFVVIVGAGGVGSWAATMLVRSGIRKLRIIDFDQVTLSSLNRHACATLSDVGRSKVHCIADFLRRVAPWCEIEPVVALWDKKNDNYRSLIADGDPDWVVDAIDNVDTKVDLLEYCYKELMNSEEVESEDAEQRKRKHRKKVKSERNNADSENTSGQSTPKEKKTVRVISAMGAGAKSDPTRVAINDISYSQEDPLARTTRRRLKKLGVMSGIPVVFSTEKPSPEKAALLPLSDEAHAEGNAEELAVLQDFRVRILPVLGPLPAIFGLTVATHILTITGGYPGVTDPVQGGYSLAGKRRAKLYDVALQTLAGQMARMGWEGISMPIDVNDVEYLIEEVFRGKSVISGESARLAITMWNPPKKGVQTAEFENLVVITKDEQKIHEREVLLGGKSVQEVYPQKVLDLVEKRMGQERYYSQFR